MFYECHLFQNQFGVSMSFDCYTLNPLLGFYFFKRNDQTFWWTLSFDHLFLVQCFYGNSQQ